MLKLGNVSLEDTSAVIIVFHVEDSERLEVLEKDMKSVFEEKEFRQVPVLFFIVKVEKQPPKEKLSSKRLKFEYFSMYNKENVPEGLNWVVQNFIL